MLKIKQERSGRRPRGVRASPILRSSPSRGGPPSLPCGAHYPLSSSLPFSLSLLSARALPPPDLAPAPLPPARRSSSPRMAARTPGTSMARQGGSSGSKAGARTTGRCTNILAQGASFQRPLGTPLAKRPLGGRGTCREVWGRRLDGARIRDGPGAKGIPEV